ncbi:hypothetical protein [Endozoicomonas sp.]|uniref:hypothetical protein n=1 Tax=Endozoicomonas sp. TaxID=1892382 RepID=UPI00383B1795
MTPPIGTNFNHDGSLAASASEPPRHPQSPELATKINIPRNADSDDQHKDLLNRGITGVTVELNAVRPTAAGEGQISSLFVKINERLTLMEEVAAWKATNKKPTEDLEQEKRVLAGTKKLAHKYGIDWDTCRAGSVSDKSGKCRKSTRLHPYPTKEWRRLRSTGRLESRDPTIGCHAFIEAQMVVAKEIQDNYRKQWQVKGNIPETVKSITETRLEIKIISEEILKLIADCLKSNQTFHPMKTLFMQSLVSGDLSVTSKKLLFEKLTAIVLSL